VIGLLGLPRQHFLSCFDEADLGRLAGKIEVLPQEASRALPDEINEAWLGERIGQAEILITGWGTPALTPAVIDRAKRLKAIVHAAGSVKTMVPRAAFERGICVTNVRHALARGVAESALGMIIASSKMFIPLVRDTAQSTWRDSKWVDWVQELYRIRVGVIGASEVGKHLLRLLGSYEVEKLVYDPYATEAQIQDLGAKKVELNDLCARSEIIVVCAPATEQTRHLIGREQFRLMKDRVRFINPARGTIVDESALIEELDKGRLTAFLDVTDPEPPAADSPLRRHPLCFVTPHIAGHVNNGCNRQGRLAVDEILRFLSEGRFQWQVAPDKLGQMG
jgi:phosphoglycerate dehydrogenase-like enzyme